MCESPDDAIVDEAGLEDGLLAQDEPAPCPAVDWLQLLDDFKSGDPRREGPAADAFIGVITRTLAARGAYKHRDSWNDLTQDVLTRLLEYDEPIREPQAWVRRATINAYVDLWRRETTEALHSDDLPQSAPWVVPSAQPPLDESVARREEAEELWDGVEKLPGSLRALVCTAYPVDPGSELDTQNEIAQQLRIKRSDVQNRLRRALQLLHRHLTRERKLGRFRLPRRRSRRWRP